MGAPAGQCGAARHRYTAPPVVAERSRVAVGRRESWQPQVGVRWPLVLLVGMALCLVAASASARPPPWTRGVSRGEDLVVELVTFGPGEAIHQVFGHSALLVRDERLRRERLYNYGMFSFGPAMLPSFLRGRLTFWVGAENPRVAFARYVREGRDIRVQTLALSPSQRLGIASFLARAILPENREYLYDHYRDNCSTRLADIINHATQGGFEQALRGPGRMTLREHTRRHVEGMPVTHFLMMHGMGGSVDLPITRSEELFLPAELESAVQAAELGERGTRRRLQAENRVVFRGSQLPPPARPGLLWPATLAVGLVLGAVVWLGARASSWCRGRYKVLAASLLIAVGAVLGLLGSLTVLLTFATDHDVARGNANVLLSNPFAFGLCGLGVAHLGQRNGWRCWLMATAVAVGLPTAVAVALALHPGFIQDNTDTLALLLPPNLAVVCAALRERMRRGMAGVRPEHQRCR